MKLGDDVLRNLIELEKQNIDFMLELINSNKVLSLSLINTFLSTIELSSDVSDMTFFNNMLLELHVSIEDNKKMQIELEELRSKLDILLSEVVDKAKTSKKQTISNDRLCDMLEELKSKQLEIQALELKLNSYTPKLLNKINKNIYRIKNPELVKSKITKIVDSSKVTTPKTMSNIDKKPESNEVQSTQAVEKKKETTHLSEEISEKKIETSAKKIETVDSTTKEEVKDNSEKVPERESLVISEISGKVKFPFTHEEVDINEFKYPVPSRFREGYRLSKEKENESGLLSIFVGLKLSLKSDLHPAIIRACRNFDDLDTYLYYASSGMANLYPNFKIEFKSFPYKNY